MEDEGFFNNYLFSSMEDIKKETKNIHLPLSK